MNLRQKPLDLVEKCIYKLFISIVNLNNEIKPHLSTYSLLLPSFVLIIASYRLKYHAVIETHRITYFRDEP